MDVSGKTTVVFRSRDDAGQQLAKLLTKYKYCPRGVVLGISPGGVAVGVDLAKELHLELDVLGPRKVTWSESSLTLGAIAETGDASVNDDALRTIGHSWKHPAIVELVLKEQIESHKRLEGYRRGRNPPELNRKTCILVDDGSSATDMILAAAKLVRGQGAAKVVYAAPVASTTTTNQIADSDLLDEVLCLKNINNEDLSSCYGDGLPVDKEKEVTFVANLLDRSLLNSPMCPKSTRSLTRPSLSRNNSEKDLAEQPQLHRHFLFGSEKGVTEQQPARKESLDLSSGLPRPTDVNSTTTQDQTREHISDETPWAV